MNYLAPTGADPVPLDFNARPNTGTVADALVSDPRLPGDPPALSPQSLLEDLGLSGHVARSIVAERSDSCALE